MNKVILKGRLTRDPEVRYTQSGKCVASFTVATDRMKGANTPADAPSADFHNCVAWEKLADLMGNYFAKGQEILLEGRLQTRDYTAQDGSKRWVTEVIMTSMEFCGSKVSNNRPDDVPPPEEEFPGASNTNPNDEDIPF